MAISETRLPGKSSSPAVAGKFVKLFTEVNEEERGQLTAWKPA
ncbi:MAG: hypothetical protein AB9891_03365 [Anaerolineaceae bacterium]